GAPVRGSVPLRRVDHGGEEPRRGLRARPGVRHRGAGPWGGRCGIGSGRVGPGGRDGGGGGDREHADDPLGGCHVTPFGAHRRGQGRPVHHRSSPKVVRRLPSACIRWPVLFTHGPPGVTVTRAPVGATVTRDPAGVTVTGDPAGVTVTRHPHGLTVIHGPAGVTAPPG